MRYTSTLLLLCLLALLPVAASAQPGQVSLTSFSTNYNAPLFLTHAGDARLFVVEKDGRIRICDQAGVKNGTAFLDINSRVGSFGSEQGLLGLAFHPHYKQNGYFYVNYTNNAGNTVVSRFSVTSNPDIADPNTEVILLTINQPYSNHNGGCLQFGRDGYLYIGMGDGGSGGDPVNAGQGNSTLLGKMLRLDVNGSAPYGIPYTNPYQGASTVPDEVWAFGLRNPWRFSFDRHNGDLWIGDVGQDVWEEIDHLAYNSDPAPNFGWRCYEGNTAYNTAGCLPASNYDMPIYDYSHSNANGCSINGGYIYRGGKYASLWGIYFFSDYCSGNLWRSSSNGSGGFTTVLNSNLVDFEYVSFGEDVFGELYAVAINQGVVYRLNDTTSAPVAAIYGDTAIVTCDSAWLLQAASHTSLSHQWQLNGADIPGADTSFLSVTSPGLYRVITSANGFSDTSAIVNVSFGVAPVVSLSGLLPSYCDSDLPAPLTGQPAGGLLTGPGVVNGNFSPNLAGPGTHAIVYSIDNGYGCADADSFLVNVAICPGTKPADLLPGFTAYPNPAQDQLVFRFANPSAATLQWELIDIQGRTSISGTETLPVGEYTHPCDVRELPQGLYLLRLTLDGQDYTKGVTIQR